MIIISWIIDKTKKFKLVMLILAISGTAFQGLFTLLLELIVSKDLNGYAIGLVLYSLINIPIISYFTIGMNYACEITYPVGESINGSIMASTPQILCIALTFLCDHFINNYKDKKWLSNTVLLMLLGLSIIFISLLDEKLDRQEIEQAGGLKKQNKIKKENKGEEITNADNKK